MSQVLKICFLAVPVRKKLLPYALLFKTGYVDFYALTQLEKLNFKVKVSLVS